MARAIGSVTIQDYNGEISTVTVNLQRLAPASLAADFLSVTQDMDEIKDTILEIIRGKVRKTQVTVVFDEDDDPVTDKEATREGKWLVTYKDTTRHLDGANAIENPGYGKLFTFEIPTAKRSLLPGATVGESLRDELPLDLPMAGDTTLKGNLEANIRSPYNWAAAAGVTPTNEVISVKFVGRNN